MIINLLKVLMVEVDAYFNDEQADYDVGILPALIMIIIGVIGIICIVFNLILTAVWK